MYTERIIIKKYLVIVLILLTGCALPRGNGQYTQMTLAEMGLTSKFVSFREIEKRAEMRLLSSVLASVN